MKFKRVLKMALLVGSIIIIVLFLVLMYFVLVVEASPFEYSMLIPLFLILTGVFSVLFHFKTLEIYKVNKVITEFKHILLWVVNVAFAVALIVLALFLTYKLLEGNFRKVNTGSVIMLCLFVLMVVIGVGLLIEERYLYNIILKNKKAVFVNRIDNIKGNRTNS